MDAPREELPKTDAPPVQAHPMAETEHEVRRPVDERQPGPGPAGTVRDVGVRTMISIVGLDKADVLAALYNNAKMQGYGIRHAAGSMPMTREQAAQHLARTTDFDYLHGRVLKVDLSEDEFWFDLYDRDNGEGKTARVIANVRDTGSIDEII